jgi:hypothetical protein
MRLLVLHIHPQRWSENYGTDVTTSPTVTVSKWCAGVPHSSNHCQVQMSQMLRFTTSDCQVMRLQVSCISYQQLSGNDVTGVTRSPTVLVRKLWQMSHIHKDRWSEWCQDLIVQVLHIPQLSGNDIANVTHACQEMRQSAPHVGTEFASQVWQKWCCKKSAIVSTLPSHSAAV